MSRLIAFDLDGTLVDSRADLVTSVNLLLREHGAAPLDEPRIAGMVGEGARLLVQRALDTAGLADDLDAALARFLEIYGQHLVDVTRPYPGLVDTLRAVAPRADLAVLTNKPNDLSVRLIDALGLSPWFRWIVGSGAGFPRKPDPAGLRDLMARAGATPDQTLMVGDTAIDVDTARRAGARVCLVYFGFGDAQAAVELRGDEFIARTPDDVGPALEQFLEGEGG